MAAPRTDRNSWLAFRVFDWPLGAAVLLFAAVLGGILLWSMHATGGHFGYPLDDTYIHMAVAKNFALHGVWGTTKYGFTSSTSSPLFSLLLAAVYAITGVHEVTPLVLNILIVLALLVWCNYAIQRIGLAAGARFALLAAIIFATPLPSLTFVSMEHVLHTLLTLLFVYVSVELLVSPAWDRPRFALLLAITGAIVTTRYEATFLVALTGLLFLGQRRWKVTAALAFASILPLAVYGWISVRHGWYALPNSLILKANLPAAHSLGLFPAFLQGLAINVTQGGHVTLLVISASVLLVLRWREQRTIWTAPALGLVLFAGTAATHLLVARVGWFFRYESYLVAFGMLAITAALAERNWKLTGMGKSVYVVLAGFVVFAGYRAEHAIVRAPQAAGDIYCQQYTMGRFARQYLNGKTVVLNDIGAVSFLSDARVLDAIGLADMAPTVARRKNEYSLDWLNGWVRANGADVAIVCPSCAPAGWEQLRTWTIPDNYISGSPVVGVYAVNPAFVAALRAKLTAFSPQLPPRVIEGRPGKSWSARNSAPPH